MTKTTCTICSRLVARHLVDLQGKCFVCAVNVPSSRDAGAHYRYEYKGIKLDPFRIAKIYGITDFGQQTILKKALRMGTAHKDRKQDLKDIICAAERMLEMIGEDSDG